MSYKAPSARTLDSWVKDKIEAGEITESVAKKLMGKLFDLQGVSAKAMRAEAKVEALEKQVEELRADKEDMVEAALQFSHWFSENGPKHWSDHSPLTSGRPVVSSSLRGFLFALEIQVGMLRIRALEIMDHIPRRMGVRRRDE